MTPADKPDLPDPDYIHTVTDGWKGGTVMHTHYWNADTVLRLLADERRKALESAIVALEAEIKWQNRYELDTEALVASIRDLIDRKEPT